MPKKKALTGFKSDYVSKSRNSIAILPAEETSVYHYPTLDVPPRALMTTYGLPRYHSKTPSAEVAVRVVSLRHKLSKVMRNKRRIMQQKEQIRQIRFSLGKKKRTKTSLVSIVKTDAGRSWLENSWSDRFYLSSFFKKRPPYRLQDNLSSKAKKIDFREHVMASRLRTRDHRKWNAAIKIQSNWRQRKAMSWFAALAALQRRHVSAVRIQGLYRRRVARNERALRARDKKKQVAATRIQSLQRGAGLRKQRAQDTKTKRLFVDKIAELEEVKRVEDERLKSMAKAETRRLGVVERLIKMLETNVHTWHETDEQLVADEKVKQTEVERLIDIVAKAEIVYQEKERVARIAQAEADEVREKQLAEEAGHYACDHANILL